MPRELTISKSASFGELTLSIWWGWDLLTTTTTFPSFTMINQGRKQHVCLTYRAVASKMRTLFSRMDSHKPSKFLSSGMSKVFSKIFTKAQELTILFSAPDFELTPCKPKSRTKALYHFLKETQWYPALDWNALFHCKGRHHWAHRVLGSISCSLSLFSLSSLSSLSSCSFASRKAEGLPISEMTASILTIPSETHLHQGLIPLYIFTITSGLSLTQISYPTLKE